MSFSTSFFRLFWILPLLLIATMLMVSLRGEDKPKPEDTAKLQENLPKTEEEARSRARWMHELVHGALQVMHRDFFDKDDSLNLPSQSLEDVFKEMARSWGVEIEWLGVNATKGKDHEPDDDFEKAAAEALKKGRPEYDAIERGTFRYVGAIRLQNECLSCHVPNRRDLKDRVAGLSISMRFDPTLLSQKKEQ